MTIANWQLFAGLWASLVLPMLATLQAMLGNVINVAHPLGLAMVALWLCIVGIDLAGGHKTIAALKRDFLLAAVAIGALQSGAVYMQWVGDLFLTAIPNTLTAALGAGASPVAAIDQVMTDALVQAATVYNALPWSLMSIPIGIAVLLFAGFAMVSAGYAFGLLVSATVVNIVAVVIGPIFIALAATPATRKYAAGWLGVLVGGVTMQLLVITLLVLLIHAEGLVITQAAAGVTAGDNSIGMLWGIGKIGILIALVTKVLKEAPAIAWAIGGGVYQNASAFERATFGAAGTAVRQTAAVTTQAARATVQRFRPTAPTGRSMSSTAGSP